MDVVRVVEYRAFLQQPFETSRVIGAKAHQVVVTKLIHHDGENQFRLLRRGRLSVNRAGKAQKQECCKEPFHRDKVHYRGTGVPAV